MPNHNTVVSVFGVEPHRIGAGEIYARELSSQLAAFGWKHVLCYFSEPPEAVRRFLEMPGVSLRVIEDSDKLAWEPSRKLARVLSEVRPRILHLYFTGFLSPYPWIARWHGVEKVFFTDQNSRPTGYQPRRYPLHRRLLSRAVNRPIDRLICISNYSLRSFVALDLLPEERFVMIYNSVDTSRADAGIPNRLEFRRAHGIPEDRVVAAQVSWMIPEKGIQDLLEAARLVIAQEAASHFLLAGGGAHLEEYRQLAVEWGIAGNVTFTGVVQDPLVHGLYAAADIGCQMSRWEEAFGYVIAEAMASSRPVVGTRVGGIPEVIEDGKTGFVVDRGDVKAMADRLLLLIRARDLRETMGRAGRARVEALFENRKNVAEVVRLYGIGPS